MSINSSAQRARFSMCLMFRMSIALLKSQFRARCRTAPIKSHSVVARTPISAGTPVGPGLLVVGSPFWRRSISWLRVSTSACVNGLARGKRSILERVEFCGLDVHRAREVISDFLHRLSQTLDARDDIARSDIGAV